LFTGCGGLPEGADLFGAFSSCTPRLSHPNTLKTGAAFRKNCIEQATNVQFGKNLYGRYHPDRTPLEGYMSEPEKLVVVIIDDAVNTDTPHGRTVKRIVNGLSDFNIQVSTIASVEDARSAYANLPEVDCLLISSTLGTAKPKQNADAKHLIHEIRKRNEEIPIFLS
jgi:hypothetical protein